MKQFLAMLFILIGLVTLINGIADNSFWQSFLGAFGFGIGLDMRYLKERR